MATKNPIFTSVISGSPTITSEKLTSSDYDAYLRYQATTSASVTSVVQTGNVSVCFTQSLSLGPWILDSKASDHISGNKHFFSSITTTSALPTVTLANGSQTMTKGLEYGEDDWHRARLGHPSLSKFQKMVLRFSTLSSFACESCQLGKHTHVSFPKRLNDRAKSPFELVHTDVWGPCWTATNYPSKLRNASSWDTLDFRRAIVVIPLTLIIIFSPLMSPSLRTLHSSHPLNLFPFLKYCQFPIYPPLSDALSRPLQVYHHRHHAIAPPRSSAEVPDDSPPVPPVSPTPTLSSTDHLPIAFRKALVRHFLILGSDRQWLMKWLLCTPMAHGILFLYLLEVYMEQPPGFVAQGESGLVCKLRRSIWLETVSSGMCIYLVVYVDDIVITDSDQEGIQRLKQHLFNHFQTKDLGKLKYFLGLEIAQSSSGVVMSQRKYVLDILEETGEPLRDPGRYRRLVGKLNYLTITRPDISFPVSVVSQFTVTM
ncbi:Retrovirus-related Pol polyprotein from transposon RE1 [Vitis vinifera]|uniref:Retrovirus-related Pol polyprotein from transposon RE1 n=1 Tax=Vitis vinifera TaxID=29760 RepID=A0A438EX34_VITVI|nr:Retrovirus-related Pol polyprotein from transposon RE1 [Vitis vinifera]